MTEVIDDQLAQDPAAPIRESLENARWQLVVDEQRQGVLDPVRRLLNAATALLSIPPLRRGAQWTTAKLMVGHLAQVARYLSRSERDAGGVTLDTRVRAGVAAAFAGGPAVVVAHSLGSVVTWEVLSEHERPVDLLVTIGSPIALRLTVLPRLRPQPPRTPECVGEWLNFWDRDDIVTARPIIADAVAANSAGVSAVSRRIDSSGLWVHTATKYLAQPGVAGPIVERLAAGSGR